MPVVGADRHQGAPGGRATLGCPASAAGQERARSTRRVVGVWSGSKGYDMLSGRRCNGLGIASRHARTGLEAARLQVSLILQAGSRAGAPGQLPTGPLRLPCTVPSYPPLSPPAPNPNPSHTRAHTRMRARAPTHSKPNPHPTPLPQVAAAAAVPLQGLLRQRRLGGSWRLKEATAAVAEADRLDLGRASVQLAWFPLQQPQQSEAVAAVVTAASAVPMSAEAVGAAPATGVALYHGLDAVMGSKGGKRR